MTTALVTGAGGFLARHLVPVLRARGTSRIVGADLRAPADAGFDATHAADLTDPGAASALLSAVAPSMVFHLVGAIRGTEAELRASNVSTAANVLDAVRASARVARVVLVGSAAEYGRVPPRDQPVPEAFRGMALSDYGRAKSEVSALAVRAARDWGMHVVLARPFNIVGAGIADTLVVGAIVRRLRAALLGPPPRVIRVGTTASVRDFVAVEDVAAGLALALERGSPGEAYNLCSGTGHTVADVLARLLALAGEPVEVGYDDALVRPGEVDALVGSWEKAARALGWRPSVPLDVSLRAAWDATAPAGTVS
ncbi:MAG: NAD-dependent epimerase/dehydratase family protein [Gemmatimonadales bacterium]